MLSPKDWVKGKNDHLSPCFQHCTEGPRECNKESKTNKRHIDEKETIFIAIHVAEER